jgi:hypothetical protein
MQPILKMLKMNVMKKYLIIILVFTGLLSCLQEEEFKNATFPGITGSGDEATWVVYTHVITDIPYVTTVLGAQTPPVTFATFDKAIVDSRQREVTAYSYKFYKNGELALIGKDDQDQNVWVKQTNLKWEELEDKIYITKNINGSWVNIITGYKDQANILFRYNKAYFGDTTADKDRVVMEILYSKF